MVGNKTVSFHLGAFFMVSIIHVKRFLLRTHCTLGEFYYVLVMSGLIRRES